MKYYSIPAITCLAHLRCPSCIGSIKWSPVARQTVQDIPQPPLLDELSSFYVDRIYPCRNRCRDCKTHAGSLSACRLAVHQLIYSRLQSKRACQEKKETCAECGRAQAYCGCAEKALGGSEGQVEEGLIGRFRRCSWFYFEIKTRDYQVSTARMFGGPEWPSITCVSITASIFIFSQLDGAFASREFKYRGL
jgi:hypothetical protein